MNSECPPHTTCNSLVRWRASCSQRAFPNYLWDLPAVHSLPEARVTFQTMTNSLPSRWAAVSRHTSDTCPMLLDTCQDSEATHPSLLSGRHAFLASGAPVAGSGNVPGRWQGSLSFLQEDFFTVLQLYSPNLCIASLWVKSTCFRNLYLDLLSLFGI